MHWNHPETVPCPSSWKKLSSTKLVPGAKRLETAAGSVGAQGASTEEINASGDRTLLKLPSSRLQENAKRISSFFKSNLFFKIMSMWF